MKKALNAFKWAGTVGGLGVWAWLGWVVFSDRSGADTLIIPNTFSVGQIADPAQVNANYDAIKTIVNGKIDDDNWDPSGPGLSSNNLAADSVVTSKILDSTILIGDLAPATIASIKPVVYSTPTSPDFVNQLNCLIGWTDIPGASWTITARGGTLVIVFTARVGPDIGAVSQHHARLVIDGTNGTDTHVLESGNSNSQLEVFTLNGSKIVASGSRTIKVQCQDNDADLVNYQGMNVTIVEY